MATKNLVARRLQKAFSNWSDRGRLTSVSAIEELANISCQCVKAHDGNQRILAYALNRFLFALLDYWENESTLDPEPFAKHGRQPISEAISLLQEDAASFDAIEPIVQRLIDAHLQILV